MTMGMSSIDTAHSRSTARSRTIRIRRFETGCRNFGTMRKIVFVTAGSVDTHIINRSTNMPCPELRLITGLAEDAVQDAPLAAWHRRNQFRQDASPATRIHRIAINSALQLIRRQRPGG